MSLKFCANLSFMFQETPSILERYGLAKKAGFKAVECAFLYSYPLEKVVQAKETQNLHQVLININPGDLTKGELGFAALPEKEEDFKKSLVQAITYCKGLQCQTLHIMAGNVPHPSDLNDKVYKDNLQLAASMLEKENIIGVIEPINKISIPGYYLNNFQKGLDVVKEINSPNIKILADLFHWKMMELDLAESIEKAFPWIGHIQIAQSPNRNEPDTQGDIDFNEVFSLLESLGYNGWIGLEYKPANETIPGLKWLEKMECSL